MAQKKLRILIADDYQIAREGIRALIERQARWEVCGSVGNGFEAVEKASELKPDIVILDMTMPELNGLDAAVRIKRRLPNTEILMFTAHESDNLIRQAFDAGIKSYVLKSDGHHFLVEAIESLSRHKPYLTAKVSEILSSNVINRAESRRGDAEPGQRRLTARERQVVQLIAEGKSNKEIGNALGISLRTVENHRANIRRKLKLDSVAGLVRYAIRNKMIEP
ncbi:MAG TPA: response regulator transcription factor [Chthoniobacterales bacterium]|nr:response regulator transcription factor [Chthoniobacterales bacterium]